SEGMVYVAERMMDDSVRVRPFFRPLGAPTKIRIQKDRSIILDDYVRVSPDGNAELIKAHPNTP
ncbi:MAG TPA: hypothetical protein VHF69_12805, partial [Candidatus Synoicihabitans sp.]|nr:hypothetical protein [Candidatus Synoicihabitans sp.]